ncbi:MAG: hypothetical protein E7258_00710 [Lachnospiraceae bacterium]|nr:hypothetical protein [Lachnospiraceae bacterium]
MSSKTKIVVLKSKELIYTGIFIVLGVLLIMLLFYMFSPDKPEKKATASSTQEISTEETVATTYKPGVYTSELNLGGSSLQLSVTVDETAITHVDITNLDETVTAMYPLLNPSLEEINNQISASNSIDDVTYSSDNKYTSIMIIEGIKKAVETAVIVP